ncbi:hypothetical protein [Azohydromonas aeria]|uniref:hypothetical protein n=1 Tax=Azohydromonas aeria TaxID=2590212 RepID=UPI0012F87E90|nr:hypothetical protein [Azohydromonas aeria]
MKRRHLLQALGLAGVVPAPWAQAQAVTGTVHRLELGMSLPALLAQARSGDVIEVMPGVHRAQAGVVTQAVLTIRGVGGTRPVFQADGVAAEGKGILVVRSAEDVRIQNLEFRGTRVPDRNGAGIRFETGHLTVQNCAFFDNQTGILTNNDPASVLEVQRCEFGFAAAPYLSHLLYVGRIRQVRVLGSYFHDGLMGHLLKSRAQYTIVRHSVLVDGASGESSYEVDLPEGGRAWLVGNVISQNALTQNPAIVSYGEETSSLAEHGLFMAHNTIVNQRSTGTFVRVSPARLAAGLEARFVNNLLVGPGELATGTLDWTAGNVRTTLDSLRDPERLDFRLVAHSPLRGSARAAGVGGGRTLAPLAEFRPPVGSRLIVPPAAWSPGAYQS